MLARESIASLGIDLEMVRGDRVMTRTDLLVDEVDRVSGRHLIRVVEEQGAACFAFLKEVRPERGPVSTRSLSQTRQSAGNVSALHTQMARPELSCSGDFEPVAASRGQA